MRIGDWLEMGLANHLTNLKEHIVKKLFLFLGGFLLLCGSVQAEEGCYRFCKQGHISSRDQAFIHRALIAALGETWVVGMPGCAEPISDSTDIGSCTMYAPNLENSMVFLQTAIPETYELLDQMVGERVCGISERNVRHYFVTSGGKRTVGAIFRAIIADEQRRCAY